MKEEDQEEDQDTHCLKENQELKNRKDKTRTPIVCVVLESPR